ncbi:uncharacterized protein LOC119356612 [Triticum dicoccoides]|uniref:uncharacterized protein LOC119356612 n=1 Tax=Triticum dicoccoides TaxID=85692 RepID=UPI00188F6BA9|nr:uncharacterized protein LOC119356612 [Triticum dicoccoides]
MAKRAHPPAKSTPRPSVRSPAAARVDRAARAFPGHGTNISIPLNSALKSGRRQTIKNATRLAVTSIPACPAQAKNPVPTSQEEGKAAAGSTMMWGVAAAVASAAAVAVASVAELLACDCAPTEPAAAVAVAVGRCDEFLLRQRESPASSGGSGSRDDKFAPRFDGLRFIETLVTAHR